MNKEERTASERSFDQQDRAIMAMLRVARALERLAATQEVIAGYRTKPAPDSLPQPGPPGSG